LIDALTAKNRFSPEIIHLAPDCVPAQDQPELGFVLTEINTMSDQQEPVFQIQRVYLKEASLEQPNSPAILLEQESPTVDIQLGVNASPVAEGIYEVTVTATVQTKIKDKTVFLVEATQAGIFEIRNLPQDQLNQIMGIACPQIVYPYLRGNVADLIQRGGFPPVHLSELNFQSMYEQQQQQQVAATAEVETSIVIQ
jgi:preprotein translocase subunit SecB